MIDEINAIERMSPEVKEWAENPVAIAIAIISDRIKRLPDADRDDLFALVQEIPKAESKEDLNSIFRTMKEILSQEPLKSRVVDPTDQVGPGPGLQKWIDFVSGRVRAAREAAGLTQVDLAERTGLPQSHISRIENGKLSPSRFTLEKIAKGLALPISQFDPSA